ncbi:MAG: aminotransferase class V-fold PLP-dependent enzyme [Saprospiraceae bacterium]|nr:aminotransferase class V-fold PLP-dependent enzyme [Saprospiraceae bacterium]
MLTCQKSLFQLPDEVSYLNCAYLSPQLRSLEAIGIQALARKNLPFTIQPKDFFEPIEQLKQFFAKLIHTPENERIAIIPSASYGIATVAKNVHLQAGDNIVVVEDQFPSNIYSWQRLAQESNAILKVIPAPNSAQRSTNWNEAILDAIDERTRLVALANVHWADGTWFDLMAIRKKTREVGALLVIDGTQSVGALPIDVAILQPDALICAGYKWLLGPYSIGLAYYGPAFDEGVPIEENWINRLNSEDFKSLVNYQSLYQPGAGRYSVGEQSNFMLVPMLSAALQQILDWGIESIQHYTKELSAKPLEKLQALGCKVEPAEHRCGHLFGIRLDPSQFDFQKLSEAFAVQKVYVSFRGSAIRVAPHVYNDELDFDKLIACFQEARISKSIAV